MQRTALPAAADAERSPDVGEPCMSKSEKDSARRNFGMRCCICIIVLLAFLYLALDGHHTKINLLFPGSTFGNPLNEIDDHITWIHGWPVACYVRNSIDTATINTTPGITDVFAKELQFSCFPFDNSPALAFSAVGLMIDVAVLLLLVTGLWMTLRAVQFPRMQFSVLSLMITMAFLSLLLATNLLFSRYLHTLLSFIAVLSTMVFCLWRVAGRIAGHPRITGESGNPVACRSTRPAT